VPNNLLKISTIGLLIIDARYIFALVEIFIIYHQKNL
jgi:hypothetical protein